MTTYPFTLRLEGLDVDDFDVFADAFFSPDLDATPAVRAGILLATFRIEASTFREAVRVAIHHVHITDPDVRVVGLETEGGRTIDEAFAA